MIDLRNLTTKEFAEMIDVEYVIVFDLMGECSHMSYVNNPYASIIARVQKENIPNDKKEIVANFIYTNICNRYEHRFYNGRGWGITLRGC